MNESDKLFFNDITQKFRLISVNWIALKSNPPCEKAITQLIDETCTLLNSWNQQIKKDDRRYLKIKEYNYIKRCRQKQELESG